MIRALFTLFRLIGEKNEESSARFTVAMENYRHSIMDPWDSAEEQIKSWMASYQRAGDTYEAPIFWKGNPDNYRRMSLKTVYANRAYLNDILPPDEFAKKYFLEQYEKRGKAFFQFNNDSWYDKLTLYDDFGNEIRYKADDWYMEHDGKKFHMAMEIYKDGHMIDKFPIEEIEAKYY